MTGPVVLGGVVFCVFLQYIVVVKTSEKEEVEAVTLRRERLKRRREEDIALGRVPPSAQERVDDGRDGRGDDCKDTSGPPIQE